MTEDRPRWWPVLRGFQSPPASGGAEQTRTDSPSKEVVEKQNEPGKSLQSVSAAQPGEHCPAMHALGRPRVFPPLTPSPAQSVERTQAFVRSKIGRAHV